MDQRTALRRAYARAIMLSVRAGGHAVNLDDPQTAATCEHISWLSAAVAKGLRAAMAEHRVPAPASFHEIEVCAQTADFMCGSEPDVIAGDITALHELVAESLEEVLEAVVDDPELLALMAEFPTNALLEVQPWAA